MSPKVQPCSCPEKRFCSALQTLEFCAQKKPLPRLLFPKILSRLMREKVPVIKESTIQHALDEIERFLPLIHHIDEAKGKHLAERAHEVLLSCLNSAAFSGNAMIVQRLRRLADCEGHPFRKQRVLAAPPRGEFPIPERVKDVFRMKAISLVDEYGVFPFYRQKVRSIHKTPIQTIADPKEKNSALILEQRLSPLPGETIILRGSFKNGLPLPGTFKLVAESQQTGFPDSLQHHGFALPACVLPLFPMRPEKMRSASKVLEEREQLRDALISRGAAFERAQLLIEQNREAALLNKAHYISLLKSLLLTICLSAPRVLPPEEIRQRLNAFFVWLGEQSCPLTAIASVHREINRAYVQEPAEAWAQFRLENPSLKSPKDALSSARRFLNEKILHAAEAQNFEGIASCYSQIVGKVIGYGCVNLMLQHASEVEQWPPPQLSLFEKKLQACAFEQQIAFISDLRETNVEKPKRFLVLKQRIEREIAICQSQKADSSFVDELERYYAARYVTAFC